MNRLSWHERLALWLVSPWVKRRLIAEAEAVRNVQAREMHTPESFDGDA